MGDTNDIYYTMGIPEMAEQHWDLNKEFARLLSEKKAAYSEYKEIKKEHDVQ